jgi:hypothetical protein
MTANSRFTDGDRVISVRNTSDVPEGFIGTLQHAQGMFDYEVTDDKGNMELFNDDELELLSVSSKVRIPNGPDRDDITPQEIQGEPQSALDKQVSGNHYKDCKIQPIEYIHANGLSYLEGNVIKYTTRHSKKNGKADIEKAIHYLELILEMEYKGETE